MTSFWTDEDERRLVELRREYETLLARRSRSGLLGLLPYRAPTSALALYQSRRLRDDLFAQIRELFGEPAWDILLDLQVARQRHYAISVTSACLASCAPPSTALRFLNLLEKAGMVESSKSPTDGRTRNVALTECAVRMMDRYLDRLGG